VAREWNRKVTWDHKVAGIKTQALLNRADKADKASKANAADSRDKVVIWEVKEAARVDKADKADPVAALVVAWVPDKEGTIYKCVD
jgi:hypothetical protein